MNFLGRAISGQFHVFPPNEQSHNPERLLAITNALPLTLSLPPAATDKELAAIEQGKKPVGAVRR